MRIVIFSVSLRQSAGDKHVPATHRRIENLTDLEFHYLTCILVASLCVFHVALAQSVPQTADGFSLRDGDRVLFYGDSITAQREYTEDIEEYVLTRFPLWKVTFFNAGVSGDKVSGGIAGPIDLRLQRDVFRQRPDVITIMLGMNDGFSLPEEPEIFSTYADGYRHIVGVIQTALPQARITLIQPSPSDEITREPEFPGGYNSVLLRYGDFVGELSRERKTQLADFNGPVTTLFYVFQPIISLLSSNSNPTAAQPLAMYISNFSRTCDWIFSASAGLLRQVSRIETGTEIHTPPSLRPNRLTPSTFCTRSE